ncbi:TAR DNA-binding protein 43 [Toxocara canis]|uniref:TAR DNA-binding protein 43 n=1 Tax=Toxocara canis TaxID=6265 RepID=A0A0B2W0H4_TOXCA|nr:TAR DNA-binding protein 43 [Toxocara canis]
MSSEATPTNGNEQHSTAVVEEAPAAKPVVEFDGYVAVAGSEAEGANVLEVPVEEDGTLRLATLEHSFPNAIGLKFKNEATGIYRTLAVNDEARTILEPKGGWGLRRYIAIFRPDTQPLKGLKRPASPEGGFSEKRKALDEHQAAHQRQLTAPVDLVVLNIDFATTKESLVKYFEKFGKVEFAEIKTDRMTGKSKGYGFVKMSTLEEQQKVLESGHLIDGRVIEVRIPMRTADPEAKKTRADMLSTKIHVGRVPDEFTLQDLYKYFSEKAQEMSPHARVDRVIIPTPRRGFAFVTFNDANVTRRFIEMQDVVIGGVSMAVSYPTPRKDADEMEFNDPYSVGYTPGMPAGPYHSFPTDNFSGANMTPIGGGGGGGAPRAYGYFQQAAMNTMSPYAGARMPGAYGVRGGRAAAGGVYSPGGRPGSGFGARSSAASRQQQTSYGQPPKGLGGFGYQ